MVRRNLLFGGISAASFGVYISGEGVYNAPQRAVEMVTVPGRNGALAIDQGRYENVVVEYPAFVHAESQKELRVKLSAFRNAIVSKVGYQRIEDNYHPEEFRMGIYLSGLEVTPVLYGTAASFTLAFECKPQRFLKLGEEKLEVASGANLNNPTPFDAHPLIVAWGNGRVHIGSGEVAVGSAPIGEITLLEEETFRKNTNPAYDRSPPRSLLESVENDDVLTGDSITLAPTALGWQVATGFLEPEVVSDDSEHGSIAWGYGGLYGKKNLYVLNAVLTLDKIWFVKGTSRTIGETITFYPTKDGQAPGPTYTFQYEIRYDAENETIGWEVTWSGEFPYAIKGEVVANSSKQFGDPTYIDCDTGEAYMIASGGEIISANWNTIIGSDLPVLSPGETELSYENTVTRLQVIPRWWQI